MTPEITVCYRHAQTETSLRCNRCNKYICAKCAQRSPVGFRCPDCMVDLEDRFYSNVKDETLNPFDRPLAQPFFTYILIAINLMVFAAMELQGGSTNSEVLIKFGANYGPFMLTDNQWWRLFTHMFLHIGAQHLIFNTIGLIVFGLESERLYGQAKFIAIYILTGLFGGLASFAISGPMTFSAGASGAVFGIIGMQLAFFAYYYYRLGNFSSDKVRSMLGLIGVNLVIGFSGITPTDNWAHLGGLVSGIILGYLLAPRYAVDQTKSPRRVYDRASFLRRWWVSLLAMLLFVAGTWNMSNYWHNHSDNTAALLNELKELMDKIPPTPESYQYNKQQQLVGLNLNQRELAAFIPANYDLSQVTDVNLPNNKLQQIPAFITTLPRLEYLNLSYNEFDQIPITTLQQIPQLKGLTLAHNHLQQLPPEITQLKNLEWLDISDNQLTQIPPELGHLTQLQALNLSDNQLTQIPLELGQLTQLQALYLGGNPLKEIPSAVKKLPLLDEIDFDLN